MVIGSVVVGGLVWVVLMAPCAGGADGEETCGAAFDRGDKNPLTNVLVLRLILAPLWVGFLPLIVFVKTSWSQFDAVWAEEQRAIAERRPRDAVGFLTPWMVGRRFNDVDGRELKVVSVKSSASSSSRGLLGKDCSAGFEMVTEPSSSTRFGSFEEASVTSCDSHVSPI